MNVEVAEWSKAVDSGSIPKGRGFKSRPQHFLTSEKYILHFVKELKSHIYFILKSIEIMISKKEVSFIN